MSGSGDEFPDAAALSREQWKIEEWQRVVKVG